MFPKKIEKQDAKGARKKIWMPGPFEAIAPPEYGYFYPKEPIPQTG